MDPSLAALEKRGGVRICSSTDPGLGSALGRWRKVGFCDDENVGYIIS